MKTNQTCLIALAVLCGCSSMEPQHAMSADQAHGLAAVIEFIEGNPNNEHLPALDPSIYFAERIEDPNNRQYVFVGFPVAAKKGYVAIFESCPGSITKYSLSLVGLSDDLQKERKGFLAAAQDTGTDYPSPCGP